MICKIPRLGLGAKQRRTEGGLSTAGLDSSSASGQRTGNVHAPAGVGLKPGARTEPFQRRALRQRAGSGSQAKPSTEKDTEEKPRLLFPPSPFSELYGTLSAAASTQSAQRNEHFSMV